MKYSGRKGKYVFQHNRHPIMELIVTGCFRMPDKGIRKE